GGLRGCRTACWGAAVSARPWRPGRRSRRDRVRAAPCRAQHWAGRHDFVIVADPDLSIEDDMARRDFTVNAIARRLDTGELVDPFGGARDLEQRVLRTVGPRSFAEDPLRIVRGLRLVSQLGLTPDEATLQQMRDEAESVRLVSAERVGGGLDSDGMGELDRKSVVEGRSGE